MVNYLTYFERNLLVFSFVYLGLKAMLNNNLI